MLPFLLDTSNSPYARLHPVPLTAVRLTGGVWARRRATTRTITLGNQLLQLEAAGCLDNFRRVSGRSDAPFKGPFFHDSDLYKWLEAASWALADSEDMAFRASVEAVIDEIELAQRPDGYLNTFFTFERADERWTNFDAHELYCAGHLIQAAVAHQRTTGMPRLLSVAVRLADHLCSVFGPEATPVFPACGHPEIELALVELYRVTRVPRYLHQAAHFIDVRGAGGLAGPNRTFNAQYYQDNVPLRHRQAPEGHAVRVMYLNAGAADLVLETGEPELRAALERQWAAMRARRMYVSGGLGARHQGEAFGEDYELPNDTAYAETCAAIGGVMWAWRMLHLGGQAGYSDAIERMLYNAILPGVGADGETYFYVNPLSDDGGHRRQAWFGCACCPPNVARTLESLPALFYSTSADGVWLHQYAASTLDVTLPDGQRVALTQTSDYPWQGLVQIELASAGSFTLFVRIPGWGQGARLTVNGRPVAVDLTPGRYAAVARDWHAGDRLELDLPLRAQWLSAHPFVTADQGQVALMRGPLLYCFENADQDGRDVRGLTIEPDAPLTLSAHPLEPGLCALTTQARYTDPAAWSALYQPAVPPAAARVPATAIPYFAWAQREPGAMRVWMSRC
jgi:hypothetical protein